VVEAQAAFLGRLWRDELATVPVSVVFVDHAPSFLRAPAIGFFADRADHIVVHDTELSEHHGFEPLLSSFRFRLDLRLHTPHTAVVSNRRDCAGFGYADPTGGRGLSPPPAIAAPTPAAPPPLPGLMQRLRIATRPERRTIARLFGSRKT
jgi:hypothetical protein